MSGTRIAGWARPLDGQDHATVEIGVDGALFAVVVANRERSDLASTGRTDLGFALQVDLPRGERPITVTARVRGADDDLTNSPSVLPPLDAGVDPGWSGALRPVGALDFASRKLIAGWAYPLAGADHATVEIGIDGAHFATLLADRDRPDMASLGRTDLGFVLPVDLPRDERPITVTARVLGADRDLPNSSWQLLPISQVATVDNPDWYREQTQKFLQWRFAEGAYFDGIYNGHQPLYGFGIEPCEPGWLERYTITHAIMTELATLDFHTLADIGGAEGYKGAMIRDMFGADVLSADLSPEACRLAERIYGLKTMPVTMEALPFEDASFDVVLCSESLEHVSQPGRSLAELLRVARKAVVITVPAEPLEQVSLSVQSGDPHAHVNWFDLHAFDHLAPSLQALDCRPILNTDPDWRQAGRSAEALVQRRPGDATLRGAARAMIAALVLRDQAMIERGAGFNGMIAVLQKQACRREGAPISLDRIIDFAVPHFCRPTP